MEQLILCTNSIYHPYNSAETPHISTVEQY